MGRFFRYLLHELTIQVFRIKTIILRPIYLLLLVGSYAIIFEARGQYILSPQEPIQLLVVGTAVVLFLGSKEYMDYRIKNGTILSDLSFPMSNFAKMIGQFSACALTNALTLFLLSIVFNRISKNLPYRSGLTEILEAFPSIIASGMLFSVLLRTNKRFMALGPLLMLALYCQSLIESVHEEAAKDVVFWVFFGWTLSLALVFAAAQLISYEQVSRDELSQEKPDQTIAQ